MLICNNSEKLCNNLLRCRGISIIQDTANADYPDIPINALNQMKPEQQILYFFLLRGFLTI